MSYELIENYVYKISHNKRELYGNIERITIPSKSTAINTAINIPIAYEKFISDAYITYTVNKTVEVYLNEVLQGTTDIVNGIGNIEFLSAEAGTFTLTVENTSCEVIVV